VRKISQIGKSTFTFITEIFFALIKIKASAKKYQILTNESIFIAFNSTYFKLFTKNNQTFSVYALRSHQAI